MSRPQPFNNNDFITPEIANKMAFPRIVNKPEELLDYGEIPRLEIGDLATSVTEKLAVATKLNEALKVTHKNGLIVTVNGARLRYAGGDIIEVESRDIVCESNGITVIYFSASTQEILNVVDEGEFELPIGAYFLARVTAIDTVVLSIIDKRPDLFLPNSLEGNLLYLSPENNLADVLDKQAARENLGLGEIATYSEEDLVGLGTTVREFITVPGNSQSLEAGKGYVFLNSSSDSIATLPLIPSGDIIIFNQTGRRIFLNSSAPLLSNGYPVSSGTGYVGDWCSYMILFKNGNAWDSYTPNDNDGVPSTTTSTPTGSGTTTTGSTTTVFGYTGALQTFAVSPGQVLEITCWGSGGSSDTGGNNANLLRHTGGAGGWVSGWYTVPTGVTSLDVIIGDFGENVEDNYAARLFFPGGRGVGGGGGLVGVRNGSNWICVAGSGGGGGTKLAMYNRYGFEPVLTPVAAVGGGGGLGNGLSNSTASSGAGGKFGTKTAGGAGGGASHFWNELNQKNGTFLNYGSYVTYKTLVYQNYYGEWEYGTGASGGFLVGGSATVIKTSHLSSPSILGSTASTVRYSGGGGAGYYGGGAGGVAVMSRVPGTNIIFIRGAGGGGGSNFVGGYNASPIPYDIPANGAVPPQTTHPNYGNSAGVPGFRGRIVIKR